MKSQTPFAEIDALERELAQIAPLVQQGFRQAGGPSLRVEDAIRQKARLAVAARERAGFAWHAYRIAAAAAGFALLLAGALELHLVHQASHNALTVRHILNIGATQASNEHPTEGPAGLANRLLDIQGLDEEGFFKAEGEEPLWL
jgi:hypothetical protein